MWPLTTKEMIYTGVQSKPSESVLACDFGVVATVRIADQETTSPKILFFRMQITDQNMISYCNKLFSCHACVWGASRKTARATSSASNN